MRGRKTERWTIGKMYTKYLLLRKQNYEQVLISDVINDLYRIQSDKRIPKEDL